MTTKKISATGRGVRSAGGSDAAPVAGRNHRARTSSRSGKAFADSDRTRPGPIEILWGPPGVGKTTLAQIIARMTKSDFIPFSAVLSGIKEIKEIMAAAERAKRRGRRTILFIDEIHRFNKAQQDAFLPHVEHGNVTLIGATTENPSFEVISALLSRSRVFVLRALTDGAS